MRHFQIAAAVFLTAFTGVATAVDVTIQVQREVTSTNAAGEQVTRLERVESAVPGEKLIYTIGYVNRESEPAENVVIVDPIPEGVSYVGGSAVGAAGADFTVSVDGGQNWTEPDEAIVTTEDGGTRPARPEDYTHLRWALREPVPVGASGAVQFEVVVD